VASGLTKIVIVSRPPLGIVFKPRATTVSSNFVTVRTYARRSRCCVRPKLEHSSKQVTPNLRNDTMS